MITTMGAAAFPPRPPSPPFGGRFFPPALDSTTCCEQSFVSIKLDGLNYFKAMLARSRAGLLHVRHRRRLIKTTSAKVERIRSRGLEFVYWYLALAFFLGFVLVFGLSFFTRPGPSSFGFSSSSFSSSCSLYQSSASHLFNLHSLFKQLPSSWRQQVQQINTGQAGQSHSGRPSGS